MVNNIEHCDRFQVDLALKGVVKCSEMDWGHHFQHVLQSTVAAHSGPLMGAAQPEIFEYLRGLETIF